MCNIWVVLQYGGSVEPRVGELRSRLGLSCDCWGGRLTLLPPPQDFSDIALKNKPSPGESRFHIVWEDGPTCPPSLPPSVGRLQSPRPRGGPSVGRICRPPTPPLQPPFHQ